MEGDEIRTQVNKFQKISCNGISVISDTSSNPNKIATNRHLFPVGDDGGGGGGWPASRIVRVSRASGGKDRHSKVWTSKGLRDRRIRLSVSTAIEFYDLQDRLGYDQPSKAVEWLIKAASSSIDALPSLHPSSFPLAADNKSVATGNDTDFEDLNPNLNHQLGQSNNNSNSNSNNNANACSSTSETSKGSGLSLSRSENRIRARERARDLTAKKEKEKEGVVVNQSSISSSFTDLLTGGRTEPRIHWTTTTCMDYNFQMPQFNIPTGDNNNNQHHQLSFFQENFGPVMSSGGGGLGSGLNRGTLQSNLMSSLPTHNNHHLQQLSMVDGSTSTNFPFFIGTEHFQASGYNESQRQQLYGGGDHGGGRHSDHYKEKSKN